MNEAQTRLNKIAPRLRDAGWSIRLTRGLTPCDARFFACLRPPLSPPIGGG